MERPWRWIVPGVIALSVMSCGSESPGPSVETGSPVLDSAASDPGDPLGDGFEVAPGTTLIGDPIPLGVVVERDGVPIVDDGWTATSVLQDDVDPLAVIDAYMRQAENEGMAEQRGTGCLDDYPLAGEVTCGGFARTDDVSDPRNLSVEFVRGRRAGIVSNHVIVRYSTTDLYWSYGQKVTDGDRPLRLPRPPPWPALPAVGEQLPDNGETMHLLTVQPGSQLAGPLRLNVDDTTGGFAAIFEVTGDPQQVLTAYLDHLADLGPTGPEPTTWTSGSATATRAYADQAGGDYFSLTLVERPDRPTWLAIEAGHD